MLGICWCHIVFKMLSNTIENIHNCINSGGLMTVMYLEIGRLNSRPISSSYPLFLGWCI